MKIQKDERILDRHLVGETILLGDEGAEVLLRCTLENCHIVVDAIGHSNHILNSKLYGCTLEFKRKLKNTQLFSCDYINCIFKGKFAGVDFGRSPWPDPATGRMYELGELVDCDFTQATLEGCRFANVDLNRQRFAPWPQFVVPQACSLAAAHRNQGWPGNFVIYLLGSTQEHKEITAIADTVSRVKKKFAVTEEELMQALSDIGEVIR